MHEDEDEDFKDPDQIWNDLLREAILDAGRNRKICIILSDGQWAHSAITARRLDDVLSALQTGTVANPLVVWPEDEAKIVSDYLNSKQEDKDDHGGDTTTAALTAFRDRVKRSLRVVVNVAPDDAFGRGAAHDSATQALKRLLPHATLNLYHKIEGEKALVSLAERCLGCGRGMETSSTGIGAARGLAGAARRRSSIRAAGRRGSRFSPFVRRLRPAVRERAQDAPFFPKVCESLCAQGRVQGPTYTKALEESRTTPSAT